MSSEPGLRAIRACVFDVYGTLLDFSSAVAAAGKPLGERAAALDELWRRKQLEYSWLRSLMRLHSDFAAVTREALDYAFEALGVEDRRLAEALLAAYRELRPYPEVPGAVAALHEGGLRLAVLSNGIPEMLEAGLAHAGLRDAFEAVLSVEEVGVFKPAPEVYALASARLGLAAGEILFLSANAWDAHGAAAFGMHSLWINRRGAPRERLPGQLAGEVPSLAAVPAMVGIA